MSENKVDVAELIVEVREAVADPGMRHNALVLKTTLTSLLDQLEQSQRDEGDLTQGLRERGLHLPSEGPFKGALTSLDEWMGYARGEKTRAEASEALVARLRGALEPFGHVADRYDANDTCDEVDPTAPVVDYGVDTSVTVGHFRASRQALQEE